MLTCADVCREYDAQPSAPYELDRLLVQGVVLRICQALYLSRQGGADTTTITTTTTTTHTLIGSRSGFSYVKRFIALDKEVPRLL